jgi:dUTP pyrophosphatase
MYCDTGKIFNTGFYMYPRSSLSKTRLRLANSVGIIDSGYRGNLIGMFDVVNIENENINEINGGDYFAKVNDRLVQICAPGLIPILVEIVENEYELGNETSERGSGGFGSSGN